MDILDIADILCEPKAAAPGLSFVCTALAVTLLKVLLHDFQQQLAICMASVVQILCAILQVSLIQLSS